MATTKQFKVLLTSMVVLSTATYQVEELPKVVRFDLTPSMVADTLLSELSKYSVLIVRCTEANADSQSHSSSIIDHNKDGGKT
ncbi:hypothetical protein MTR67_019750 [Solanum verrucosum]|uniref:Uncharacterized protein n=1 Tax=Solanum verrucosum TaxID=315347 RepID=A0AAF0TU85_SOLVR|nr:hypothetical protein MTR67_019750 [Solanum verrucosum]